MKIVILTNPKDEFSGHFLSALDKDIQSSCQVLTIERRQNNYTITEKIKYFNKYIGVRLFQYYLTNLKSNMTIEKVATRYNIPINKISIQKLKLELELKQPDICISASLSHILPKEIIGIPKECFNVHPSLLPKHRGPNPVFWSLYFREDYYGVTIHKNNEDIDAGKIICQAKLPIDKKDETFLSNYATSVAGNLFSQYIKNPKKFKLIIPTEKGSYENRPTLYERTKWWEYVTNRAKPKKNQKV